MLISFARTFILLLCVIGAVRLMGKRQIGQLQPSELVITILLSQIAATPMQDNDLPMLNTVVAILVLAGAEIVMSVVGMKNTAVRTFLEGSPVIVIRNGELDQKQLKRLRYTVDDVAEALRQKNIFDMSQVEYAVAETNGMLNVLLKPEFRPATTSDVGKIPPNNGMPMPVVTDGRILKEGLKVLGISKEKLEKKIGSKGVTVDKIFYMTMDFKGNTVIVKKEEDI